MDLPKLTQRARAVADGTQVWACLTPGPSCSTPQTQTPRFRGVRGCTHVILTLPSPLSQEGWTECSGGEEVSGLGAVWPAGEGSVPIKWSLRFCVCHGLTAHALVPASPVRPSCPP